MCILYTDILYTYSFIHTLCYSSNIHMPSYIPAHGTVPGPGHDYSRDPADVLDVEHLRGAHVLYTYTYIMYISYIYVSTI